MRERMRMIFVKPHHSGHECSQCSNIFCLNSYILNFQNTKKLYKILLSLSVSDDEFSTTYMGKFVPYATAGDCYSSSNCPQVGLTNLFVNRVQVEPANTEDLIIRFKNLWYGFVYVCSEQQ